MRIHSVMYNQEPKRCQARALQSLTSTLATLSRFARLAKPALKLIPCAVVQLQDRRALGLRVELGFGENFAARGVHLPDQEENIRFLLHRPALPSYVGRRRVGKQSRSVFVLLRRSNAGSEPAWFRDIKRSRQPGLK